MGSRLLSVVIIIAASGIGGLGGMPTAAGEDDPPLSLAPRIGEIVPRASRDVTPPGFTPGPPITGPLVRVPSPVPQKPRRRPPPGRKRLYNPEIVSAGLIHTAAGPVSIAHIEAPDNEAVCSNASGTWPCGMVARTQLRLLIRGRAIDCELPPGADEVPEVARCYVVGQDVGRWLVQHGWALPSDSIYSELGDRARKAKRGLWGTGRASTTGVVCFSNC